MIIRVIAHNRARDWHDVTEDFFRRADDYCCKSKADIWIQRYDGKQTLSQALAQRGRDRR